MNKTEMFLWVVWALVLAALFMGSGGSIEQRNTLECLRQGDLAHTRADTLKIISRDETCRKYLLRNELAP